MWNPRLVSEDVGVGINVRRLRRDFLRYFSVFDRESFIILKGCVWSCTSVS